MVGTADVVAVGQPGRILLVLVLEGAQPLHAVVGRVVVVAQAGDVLLRGSAVHDVTTFELSHPASAVQDQTVAVLFGFCAATEAALDGIEQDLQLLASLLAEAVSTPGSGVVRSPEPLVRRSHLLPYRLDVAVARRPGWRGGDEQGNPEKVLHIPTPTSSLWPKHSS
uniref:Uncharacterized protein n=1 Tax=Ixodes ricinus TaxID=34613 RepID=A0A6B0UY44_IXORI